MRPSAWLARFLPACVLALALLGTGAAPLRAQVAPTDASLSDLDENSVTAGAWRIPNNVFSDMPWAYQHDARWAASTVTHATGWKANVASMAARGNTFFMRTGDAFTKFLSTYQDILKMYQIYKEMENTLRFLKEYRLNINLMRFAPHMTLQLTDTVGEDGKVFAVGFFPNSHDGWEKRANLFQDNPYYLKRPGAMRLVEIRYPRSLDDIGMKLSIWGGEHLEADEWQRWMLAGFYDGVYSASAFMDGIGIENNMAANARNLGPKALADMRLQSLQRRIQSLDTRRKLLRDAMSGHLSPDADNVALTPEEMNRQISLIDAEILRLEKECAEAGAVEAGKSAVWMKKFAFVNEILAKLEDPDRRLAVATLSTQYKKWEPFWATPDLMNPTPEITGNKKVDSACLLIWQACTLLSRGRIPPPVPVAGGQAAEAQALMVRAKSRAHMADELRATRQLLSFAYQDEQQKKGIVVVKDGKAQVEALIAKLEAGKGQVDRLEALVKIKQGLNGWNF